VNLRPGEKRQLRFTLGPEQLGFYNRDMRFTVEPGEFKVMIGTSSADPHELAASFEVQR